MPGRTHSFFAFFLLASAVAMAATASAGDKVIRVAPGYLHSCALTSLGHVYCWGMQRVNGRPESTTAALPVEGLAKAVALTSGHVNSCILDEGGAAWCWGVDLQASVRENHAVVSGPTQVRGLPAASMIASGNMHSCAIAKQNGSVWCWGANAAGELGNGTTVDSAEPVRAGTLEDATWIATGMNNTCAVLAGGVAYCWGTDLASGGQMVKSLVPEKVPSVESLTAIANGRNFFCGLNSSAAVICFGSNIMNQLGDSTLGQTYTMGRPAGVAGVREIGTGGFFGCALLRSGEVSCWGHLPGGDELDFSGADPRPVPGLKGATSLGVGLGTACVLQSDGRTLCWGSNEKGQIGNGRTSPAETAPAEVQGLPGGKNEELEAHFGDKPHAMGTEYADAELLRGLSNMPKGVAVPTWWPSGAADGDAGQSSSR